MKKYLLALFSILFLSSSIFAFTPEAFDNETDEIDYGSEAEDAEKISLKTEGIGEENTADTEASAAVKEEAKKNFVIGFDVSLLGIEPLFEVRQGHKDITAGISFGYYSEDFKEFLLSEGETDSATSDSENRYAVISPVFDFGYITEFEDCATFGIGFSNIFTMVTNAKGVKLQELPSIYYKFGFNFDIFEVTAKVYTPLISLGYDSDKPDTMSFVSVFTDYNTLIESLLLTNVGFKIHVN